MAIADSKSLLAEIMNAVDDHVTAKVWNTAMTGTVIILMNRLKNVKSLPKIILISIGINSN